MIVMENIGIMVLCKLVVLNCCKGDIIGSVLDLEAKTISFYRNGKDMGVAFTNIVIGEGLYPAASLQRK